MGRAHDGEYKQMVMNPDYNATYQAWVSADSAYQTACSRARIENGGNWFEINAANRALNAAKARLDSTPKYVSL